jgi:hypothetical protein
MRFLPQTKSDWGRFVLFPFKAYVAIAFPLTYLIANVSGHGGWVLFEPILGGYQVCCLVLLFGGLMQWFLGSRQQAATTFIFSLIPLLVFVLLVL